MSAKIKNNSAKKSYPRHKPKGVPSREFEKVHWPYLPILVVAVFLLTLVIQSGALPLALQRGNSKVLAYATSMSVSGLLSSTNAARSSNGLGALSLNAKLNAAAQAKANDMANRNYWSHNTPEGNPPWIFVNNQNYSYKKLGENLATGFNDEQSTVNGWMASPSHKANMLDSAFLEVGFGYANNPDYTAAGGGPMTIIVAFYGQPLGAATPTPAPAATASPPSPSPAKKPAPTPAPAAPPPTPVPVAQASPENPEAELPQNPNTSNQQAARNNEPVTTETDQTGVTLSFRASNASLALANTPVSSFATGMAIFGIIAAAGLWISKHAMAIRRSLVRSEAYIFKHPLIDAGLILIAVLSYLLTQTAGFIL